MHFDVWVIVPPGSASEMRAAADAALDPFDMASHQRPTQLPCICVGQVAAEWGRDQARRDLPEVHHAVGEEHDGAYLRALSTATTPEERAQAAAEHHARYMTHVKPLELRLSAAAEEYARTHPLHEKPTPDCRWCAGAGHVTEVMNPDGHFDYYTVTGLSSATDLLDQGAGAHAVVADGVWHEHEVSFTATPEARQEAHWAWTQQMRNLLPADAMVAIADCHG